MGKQHRRTPGSSAVHAKPEMEMILRRDDLRPGDRISIDQYVCKVKGRLPHTFGKDKEENQYSGGTIFVDHASSFVYVQNQVSLRAGETIQAKHDFEYFGRQCGITFKSYHADNHPFGSKEFR